MKKLIILIIINFAIAANLTTIYKKIKQKNNTIEETLIGIKKDFISKINFFIPNYLNINDEKSFVNYSAKYSTLNHKASSSFTLHLRFPSFQILKKTLRKKQKNKSTSSSFTTFEYKIRPYVRLKKGKIKVFLSNSFKIKKNSAVNFTFLEKIDLYSDGYWEEKSEFSINKNKNTATLNISTNKNEKNNLFYTLGFYHSHIFYKKLYVLGYELSGEKEKAPFIYSHTFFISYRHALFNTKRIYYEIKPFLFYSKEYDFKLKEGVNFSFHYKF
ncbi:hypothetical protein [Caminibacter sp.]